MLDMESPLKIVKIDTLVRNLIKMYGYKLDVGESFDELNDLMDVA